MEIIGGYRLVRRIGSGERAEVFLGHAAGAAEARSAAIKVYRASTPLAGIEVEIAAIGRASSPHVVRLDDLATAPDGLPALVLGRLRPVTLARLLAARGRIELGEAVTVIAPLADAVAALHRVGVSHGRIGQRSVLFDDSGAPVLASFGGAGIFGPAPGVAPASGMTPAELALHDGVGRDLADLAELARSVLTRTSGAPGRDAALAWLNGTEPAAEPHRFATRLAEVMFDAAPATPVLAPGSDGAADAGGRRTGSSGIRAAGIRPAGEADAAAGERDGPRPRGRRRQAARPDWLAAMHIPDWVENLLPPVPRPPRAVSRPPRLSRVSRWLAPVRRPIWLGAAAVAVALVAALVLVPAQGGAAPPEASAPLDAIAPPDASGKPNGTGSREVSAPRDAAAPSDGTAVPGDASGPDADRDGSDAESAIAGDDPVVAVLALLERRRGCLLDGSVLCLDGVHQAGSAAWEADSHRVRASQEGEGTAPLPDPQNLPNHPDPAGVQGAALVERIGNSALVTIPAPAEGATEISFLLIKSDIGWRIRDLIAW